MIEEHIKKDNKSHIFKHLHSTATCFDLLNNSLCFKTIHKAVTALNRGTSIYLTNLLGMFDVLTEQEIAKVKPYIY